MKISFKALFFWLCLTTLGNSSNPLDTVISQLAKKVNDFQVLKPLNSSPPFHWYEKKGN